jgi:hypothetical protein
MGSRPRFFIEPTAESELKFLGSKRLEQLELLERLKRSGHQPMSPR